MGLHISMHNTLAVAEVQCLQQLIDIIADIKVGEARVQGSEVGVVDILEDQARCLALVIAHHIEQSYDVGTSRQILENLDLTLDLLLLDRLKDLDNTFLVIDDIDALEHFRIFAATYPDMISFEIISMAKVVKTIGGHD